MKVERVVRELVAHQFTNYTKDSLFMLLHWYHCSVDPSFDKDNNPIMKIRFGENCEERTVKFTDWVILDNNTDTVVEILTDEQFTVKYKTVPEPIITDTTIGTDFAIVEYDDDIDSTNEYKQN